MDERSVPRDQAEGSAPQPPAPSSPSAGPQSPAGGAPAPEAQSAPPEPQFAPAPVAPQSPAATPSAASPVAYGDSVPPGGWNQPIAQPPVPFAGRYASWWSRVGAALIDGLIVSLPAILIGFLIVGGVVAAFAGSEGAGIVALIVGVLVYLVLLLLIGALYAPLLMKRDGKANGQTWGKQALGIRVVHVDGRPMTFGSAALREIAVKGLLGSVAASFTFGIAALLDALWPLWDDQSRSLHDMVVNTRVVRT